MKIEILRKQEFDVKFIKANCGVRHWEDGTINGEEDGDGNLIPCRDGDNWSPVIDIETGIIQNWVTGVTADLHYKICDDGDYALLDKDMNEIVKIEGYVPDIMCPNGEGYGDYVIMHIDKNGRIDNWSNEYLGEFTGFDD